ncbi:sugar ABC transporter ATP-binding protein [Cohnella herbarum]|uniref:Sugar ABC transporter ATP-binding protein n=1 Tax=Cohnella herbarum TaxID=2728023 RepID=A0A7Z2VHG8_9BACL|nr:sugar ABC transporter ATP-binding protein [Cohnella herbarum]QJD83127.1 sugar ABC transporter ATP-binding protein [Cohnella herbarum]
MGETILTMRGMTKSYFGVKALDGVSLDIRKGEVHALMGENGAGKSTLMKILTGLVKPDEGEIVFEGTKVQFPNPQAALNVGIAMIHQELNPIPEMTVAENIYLGREPCFPGTPFVNKKKLEEQTRRLLEQFQFRAQPHTKVGQLSVAQKQMLEIIKAISYQAKLIIMDEPTSALSESEVKTLFQTIERLKGQGVPIIYISHRMEEIFAITDRITVLRDGKLIGSRKSSELDSDGLISMMVGRSLDAIYPKEEAAIGDTVLEVRGLTRRPYFANVSFSVRQGEILGIAGLMGAGRSEVMRAIFGIDRPDGGEVLMEGEAIKVRHPADAIRHRIGFVTEDRKELGLVLSQSIRENMTLASLSKTSKGPFVSRPAETALCDGMTASIRIKMNRMEQEVLTLSGGNQQKVVIAKWLLTSPKLLILDEPTRGIDVGAKAEIYRMMSKLAQQGMAIIMVSSELPEVLGMSDRILVMGEGEIRGEFNRGEITQEQILECAIGGGRIA